MVTASEAHLATSIVLEVYLTVFFFDTADFRTFVSSMKLIRLAFTSASWRITSMA